MQNENEEVIDFTNDTEETVNEVIETQEVAPQEDELDSLKKTISTLEAQKEHWRKKATESKGSSEDKVTSKSSNSLSPVDIIAISKANIEAEDIEDVLEYAKFKGISVVEALKSSVIKATLAEKAEIRQSAQATNTGGSRRGTSHISDAQLLANAQKGILPESDADMDRLASLQVNRKR